MFNLDGLEPGPLPDAPLPFAPRVFGGTPFARLAEPLVNAFQAGASTLADAAERVGADVPSDIDAAFESSVVDAQDAQATHAPVTDASTVPNLISAGVGVDVRRASVERYFPPADTSLDFSFAPPPLPDPSLGGHIEPPDVQTPDAPYTEPPPPALPAAEPPPVVASPPPPSEPGPSAGGYETPPENHQPENKDLS